MGDLNLLQYLICFALIYLIIKSDDKPDARTYKEFCRYCGMIVEPSSLDCPQCNEEIKIQCENCGKIIYKDWRYCPFCESEEVERKIYH